MEQLPSYELGVERGVERGKLETARVMIEKFGISVEKIAKQNANITFKLPSLAYNR